jgi:predicted small metal-binding protein
VSVRGSALADVTFGIDRVAYTPPRPQRKGAQMAKQVNCPCGETVRGESDDELVSNVEAHIQDRHPEMVGTMSREQILGMAQEAA